MISLNPLIFMRRRPHRLSRRYAEIDPRDLTFLGLYNVFLADIKRGKCLWRVFGYSISYSLFPSLFLACTHTKYSNLLLAKRSNCFAARVKMHKFHVHTARHHSRMPHLKQTHTRLLSLRPIQTIYMKMLFTPTTSEYLEQTKLTSPTNTQ